MNELIIINQLPIITEHLEARSKEIKQKIDESLSMICTDETVKIIKVVRADLTKEFNALEDQRKQVKNAIMAPYNAFEAIYKANVTDLFKPADDQLKAKIADVEDSIKVYKSADIREYFDSYLADFPTIDFLTFERVGLNITKTANVEALKKQCADFINKVSDDLDMIALQPDQAEILVEYIQTLNAAQSITTIAAKHRAIEAQKAAIEAQKQAYKPMPAPEIVPEVTTEEDIRNLIEAMPEPVEPEIAWVRYESEYEQFTGQEYSYLIPEEGVFHVGDIFQLDTKRGKSWAQITRFGMLKEVPANILPFLKSLPEPIDEFAIPAPDFGFCDAFEEAPKKTATFRIAIVDTEERIDALIEMLNTLGYKYHEC